MSLARWAKRRDKNESELVRIARQLGAQLWQIDKPCDFLMAFAGRMHAVEIKTPKGKFTEAQLEFRRSVQEMGGRVLVWRTTQDVVDCLNGLRCETWRRAI